MSENKAKVEGVKQLPIFPFPLVLLPHEFLPLHIFEPKYREMLEDANLLNRLFGISFFEPFDNFIEKPPIDSIGCVTEIQETEILPDGRSNILTVGVIRYRIVNFVEIDKPYSVAEVEFFDDEETVEDTQQIADEVFSLFSRIARAAHRASGHGGQFQEIPQASPEQLSFLVCAAINMDIETKYRMLETRSTIERLAHVREALLQTVDQIEETAEINQVSTTNGYSKKDIDLDGI